MKDFEILLQCPVTHQPLIQLNERELEELNSAVQEKLIVFANGQAVEQRIQAALKGQDGFFYIVQDDIFCLLPGYALIRTDQANALAAEFQTLRSEKQNVQDFYNLIGWKKGDDGLFLDTAKFEETRPVARNYISKCHKRLKGHLDGAGGQYLLDVASGPLQFPEYREYSEKYEKRICVDLSFAALKAAKEQLGDRGIYILGDITNLPLRSGSVDAVLSLHTIYHVPANEQTNAFQELHRVLKPGGKALVVYSWGSHSPIMNILLFPAKLVVRGPRKILGFLRNWLSPSEKSEEELVLYYHPYSYDWFKKQVWNFNYKIVVWRSISPDFSKFYISKKVFGEKLLAAIYGLEQRFPFFLGRYGQYPLIIISK